MKKKAIKILLTLLTNKTINQININKYEFQIGLFLLYSVFLCNLLLKKNVLCNLFFRKQNHTFDVEVSKTYKNLSHITCDTFGIMGLLKPDFKMCALRSCSQCRLELQWLQADFCRECRGKGCV